MVEKLKEQVCQANIGLVKYGLVVFTWGNVSGIDREKGLVVIKPSGVLYENLSPDDMVVLNLEGNVMEGKLKPSSDTPAHMVLYNRFKTIGGIVHTHSSWATAWAQAGRSIPAYGTTHADYFHGRIPCTRPLSEGEVRKAYELNTGNVIRETFKEIDPLEVPGCLVCQHGPFTWGRTPEDALHNAVVLEEVARMAYHTEMLGTRTSIDQYLLNKHFQRKHGKDAYYGQ